MEILIKYGARKYHCRRKKDKLNGSFLHYSYESLEDYLTKFNRYTSMYAKGKAEKNKNIHFSDTFKSNFF
jgi:hypothetical protein